MAFRLRSTPKRKKKTCRRIMQGCETKFLHLILFPRGWIRLMQCMHLIGKAFKSAKNNSEFLRDLCRTSSAFLPKCLNISGKIYKQSCRQHFAQTISFRVWQVSYAASDRTQRISWYSVLAYLSIFCISHTNMTSAASGIVNISDIGKCILA